jgi:hypothetical protein
VVLPYYLFHVEKHICLSRDMQVTGAAWWTAIMIETGVGDLVQMIEDGQSQVDDRGWSITSRVLGGRTIEMSRDTVYGLHCAQGDYERRFLGSVSKPRSTISPDLPSKPVATVCENHWDEFLGLGLKTDSCGLVIWPIKSP